jgi:hypothetical protein
MKLDGKAATVQGDDIGLEGQDATIDKASMGKLFGFLQDPYKNPIGAIVREYVSNCFDAHAEADFIKNSTIAKIRQEYPIYDEVDDAEIIALKTQLQVFDDDAVYVGISKDATGHFWVAEDFGVGLSPQRVTDVFCSYLKSTKESTNNLIGAFGIGSKSGLSYADLFFIRTRYNGMEYDFMLRKGEEAPRLEKLGEKATTERNGTQIKIYINSNLDVTKFKKECRNQLVYFDNVYFNDEVEIINEYTILQGKNWIKSSNGTPFKGLHLCLGKVAYPIDWDQLGYPRVEADLGLKFEIGELDVIPTREDIKYNLKTKTAVIEKINALREEVLAKWEAEGDYLIDDLDAFFLKRGTAPSITYHAAIGNFSVNIELNQVLDENLKGVWKFTPFMNVGLRNPWNMGELLLEYYVPSQITGAGFRNLDRMLDVESILNRTHYYFKDVMPYRIRDNHTPLKSRYIREYEGENIPLIRKKKVPLKKWRQILGLKSDEKHLWRKQIKTAQKLAQKYVIDRTISYDNTVMDPVWVAENRKARKQIDRRKFNIDLFNSNGGRWETTKWMKGDVDADNRTLIIAGIKEQRDDLKIIGDFFQSMHKNVADFRMLGTDHERARLKVGYVAPTNLRYLENIPNLITVATLKKSRPFQRAMTAYHVRTLSKYKFILNIVDTYDKRLWSNVYSKINCAIGKAHEYMDVNGIFKKEKDFNGKEIIESGYQYVKELDAFDKDFMELLDMIGEYITNIPMIQVAAHIGQIAKSDSMKVKDGVWEEMAIEIVKGIYLHNQTVPIRKQKKVNGVYYPEFRAGNMFTDIQRPKFQYYEC